ncbi:ferrochelatase [Opitutales bacterium ASA1]|uniref:ferrochelatase n=1 Tax=Congregicoccus parvus TaxID=3081749 RepID=UPI002B2C6C8B|nr:ferrochelatase [Opitutales bacterium ASA1]
MAKKAVLLVNLGSPDSTSVKDVRRYLDEFLSDDRVIDAPKPIQQFVLKCFILPRRPKQSAHAYQSIWQPEGSPLMITSKRLRTLVQAGLDVPVELAMRYGNPSIPSVLAQIAASGVEELFLVPLYPHYAMSSYETVVVRVHEEIRAKYPGIRVSTLQPFPDDPEYIEALYQSAKADLDSGYDMVLFSYHGIPVRHLRKADSSKAHCQIVPDCCTTCSPAHATCYRAQCVKTTEAFVRRAGIPKEKWFLSFQSRLAGEPWLQPYTDHTLERFGKEGVKRLLVMTPAFVSDCLETLEEIAEEGKETFVEAGGGYFKQIPCLNEHPLWVQFLQKRVRGWLEKSTLAPL